MKHHPEIVAVYRKMHAERMVDSVYRDGYESNKMEDNPYICPTDLDIERTRLACVDRPLTEDEKVTLKRMNEVIDGTSWSRWSFGRHARYYCEYRLDLL